MDPLDQQLVDNLMACINDLEDYEAEFIRGINNYPIEWELSDKQKDWLDRLNDKYQSADEIDDDDDDEDEEYI